MWGRLWLCQVGVQNKLGADRQLTKKEAPMDTHADTEKEAATQPDRPTNT